MPGVGAAIAAFVGAVKTFAAAAIWKSFFGRVILSIGLSLLAQKLAPKPKIEQRGIQTNVTTTGGTDPQAFIIGRYATAGHLVGPPYSHGTAGRTPNAYLTYIIELSDVPGVTLSRVIVNDKYSALDATPHADYGFPLLGHRVDGTDYAWVKFYDGTQTTADAMLVDKYGSHPDRPWTANHIGTGTAYAVLTFRYNREIFNGLPSVRFELDGIPLYDPRKDSSVGGSGTHRWDTSATWEQTDNPIVMIYNLMRGITLPSGDVYGGGLAADEIPLASVFAAANACDVLIGSRATYRAGFEVDVSVEPADVIEELLKTCAGQISEFGGVFRFRVGPPGAAVYAFTDDDLSISHPQSFDPFPGLEQSYNAISARYPEPQSLWQPSDVPQITNSAWEAEDGGRRLPVEMSFPACPYRSQVAQLIDSYIADHRRTRRHRLVLPPDAAILEPLDVISWTSERNGYSNKLFEVVEVVDHPSTLMQEVVLRERDPNDYGWSSGDDLPQPPDYSGVTPPGAQVVEQWTVTATTIKDAGGLSRRPAIRLAWTGTAAEDAQFVRFEVRLAATQEIVTSGVADRAAGFVLISEGILPETEYEARGRYVLDRPTEWSAWLSVTTDAIYLSDQDFAGGIAQLFQDAGLSPVEIVDSLPTVGNFQGRIVYLTTDNRLYKWTGTEWTTDIVNAEDIQGLLTSDQIAEIEAAKVSGQLTDSQIASISTAKLLGTISGTQIANGAISTAKIQANAITASQIAAGAVAADEIAANAVTAAKISAGAITSAKIATGAVLADKIAANGVTATKIDAGAVTSDKIAANAITAGLIAAGAVSADKISVSQLSAISSQLGTILVDTANIANGAIESAKINNLAVDTIKIANRAVTTQSSATPADFTTTSSSYVTAGSLSFTSPSSSQQVLVGVSFMFEVISGAENNANIGLYRVVFNGAIIADGVVTAENTQPNLQRVTAIASRLTIAGTNTLSIQMRDSLSSTGSQASAQSMSLFALQAFK